MTTYRETLAREREAAKQLAKIARDGVTVQRFEAGMASGLSRDVGVEGKRRARASSKLYGDGTRRGALSGLWSAETRAVVMVAVGKWVSYSNS